MTDDDLRHDLGVRLLAALRADHPSSELAGPVRSMPGGASSLTYSADVIDSAHPQGRRLILKVAPPGLEPVRNRDMLRQARLLKALRAYPEVRVPQVVVEDAGRPNDIPPFYAMTFVPGECFEPIGDPTTDVPPGEEIRARELDCARQLGHFHSVDPAQVGLADEKMSMPADEIERWARLIATIDEDLRPGAEDIAQALRASEPSGLDPVLIHGDYRLGNTLASDGRVNAIIDFEIWSIGDPRIDLSWYLMHLERRRLPTAVRDVDGMPTEAELLAQYGEVVGSVPADLNWFHALTQFKGAAIVGQIVKRNRRAPTPSERVSSWDPHVPPTFLANARQYLDLL